jgi:hypothetical protein
MRFMSTFNVLLTSENIKYLLKLSDIYVYVMQTRTTTIEGQSYSPNPVPLLFISQSTPKYYPSPCHI